MDIVNSKKKKRFGKIKTRVRKFLRASMCAAGSPCVKQLYDAGDPREG